jgi:hypothetical protein
MPLPSVPVSNERQAESGTRQIGTLVKSEVWWRAHYEDIRERGYKLRPRYHPSWEPSWTKSGDDFFSAEDGQATIVSCIVFLATL